METFTETPAEPKQSRSRPRTEKTSRFLVSGDAAGRIETARQWLAEYPSDAEILVVAPHRTAADDLLRESVAADGARFGLVRLTLERLAALLATPGLASSGKTPATGFSLTALAARVTHTHLDDGMLDYFEPVARRPGFAHALASTLAEIRMNRVSLEAVRGLPRAGEELAGLIARAAQELEATGLADRATVFETALDAVAEASAPSPVGFPVLLLDVPVSNLLEAELVGRIVERAPAVLATAAAGDETTIRLLRDVFATDPETVEPGGDSSLATLKRHLFEDSAPDGTTLDDTVRVQHLPGEARECVEIARSIRKEAEWGIPFDRMAILLRSGTEYRPFVEEALRRAKIPAHFARGTTRPDPAGRALLALLACAAEDLSARRFAEYLSLAQVPDPDRPPDDPGLWVPPDSDLLALTDVAAAARSGCEDGELVDDPESVAVVGGTLRAPWRWEQLLVDAAVIGGRGRWQERLGGLEAELRLRHRHALDESEESRAAAAERQLRDLDHLRNFALPLIERLAELPSGATWGEWLGHLQDLARNALRRPETVLSVLSELAPMHPVGPVDLDEVRLILEPRLRELTDPPERSRYGAVFVGPTDAARGMEFDVVFVPGLAEKLFPRRIPEDPILLDEERERLGIPELTRQTDRVAGERLALRLSAGAARRRVWLSWPRVDVEKARPRVPSFYGLEVHRAASGVLPGFDELAARAHPDGAGRLGWPAPERPDDAIDESEYDLAVLARFMGKKGAATGAAHYLLTANPHLGRALRARARRWLRRWTSADGLVDPQGIVRKALAHHQMSARSFSPTALQHFATCPYRFFLQALLRLQPREEPAAVEALDPLTKGGLFHEVQFEVLTELDTKGLLPVRLDQLDEVLPVVDAKLDDVAGRYAEELVPAIPRVWDDEVNAIRADLREWLRRSAESEDGWVPHRFELSFGIADRDRPQADPTSLPDPVETVAPLRLRGAIDLVERHSGRGTLRATDHKTGKARARKDVVVGGGQVLQPVLYALALEKLLGEPVESGRLYYCTADGEYEERIVPLDERSRSAAREVVCTVDHALADGFLPAAPAENACDWCDYRMVCGPYEQIRTAQKPKSRLADLRRLRAMP